MQIGVPGLILVALIAYGFARVLDAPRWVGRAIPLAVILAMLASQVMLPPEAAFRQSVGGLLRAFALLLALAVPVLGYRWLLRRLRARRSGVAADAPPPPEGFVLFVDDAALTAEVEAANAAEAGPVPEVSRFTVGHRGAGGAVTASARVALGEGLAQIGPLRVEPGARGKGLGQRLLRQVEREAVARGAARAVLETRVPGFADWARAQGFRDTGRVEVPEGPDRMILTKDLA